MVFIIQEGIHNIIVAMVTMEQDYAKISEFQRNQFHTNRGLSWGNVQLVARESPRE